jgi:UDP-N-acetylmuramoylalanine--D-glutamate ligase
MFENKKILILGMGREGISTLNFFKKFYPRISVSTTDKKDGDDYLNDIKKFDLIIKSPGISWNVEQIKEARNAGVSFTSQTQIFLEHFRNQTVGITGTKGKSTTSSLIYTILKSANKKVKLVGNIGRPVLDTIDSFNDDSIFVYEMSSHQLSDVTLSPHVAVFLNIYPEHLDYYSSYEDYFRAKTNIAKYQLESDVFIYNNGFKEIVEFANNLNSKKVSFSSNDNLEDLGVKLDSNPLIGKHNLNNIMAAVLAAQSLGVSSDVIKKGIETFEPLEDRLELIKKVSGVSFVNDGLATIPQATISAILAFDKENLTLILGGYDRGVDFDILGKFLKTNNDVKNVILIGQTANKIEKSLTDNKFTGNIYNLGKVSMKNIVEKAFEVTKPKGVVLLSPSATSFDMFKDYKDRDDQFKEAVNQLFQASP